MNEFELRVLKVIKDFDLINDNDKIIIVGVSGGPDSIALLQCLYNISKECCFDRNGKIKVKTRVSQSKKETFCFNIIAVHVNHGIRENAKLDEAYVERFCKKRKISLELIGYDVPGIAKEIKCGLEEAGRIVRYQSFTDIAFEYNTNKIAIAHNKKDKVETILMNAMRGCGPHGLRGIEEVSRKGLYTFIRPLIQESRENIENYLKSQRIKPRIDESNFDNTYTRNKIRNVVIPYVEDNFNPNFLDSICRMSELIKEEDEFLEQIANELYFDVLIKYRYCNDERFETDNEELEMLVVDKESINRPELKETKTMEFKDIDDLDEEDDDVEVLLFNQIVLDLKKFNYQYYILQKRILLKAIQILFGTTQGIEQIHINDMIKLCNNNIGNKFLLPNKYTQIVIKNKKIYLNRLK